MNMSVSDRAALEERYAFAYTALAHQTAPTPNIRAAMPILTRLAQDIMDAHARFQSEIRTGNIPDAAHLTITPHVVIPDSVRSIFSQIPVAIRNSLTKYKHYTVSLSFLVDVREVSLTLILRYSRKLSRTEIIDQFIRRIYIACNVMSKNASNEKCASKLALFILASPIQKTFPESRADDIGVEHANTAFTYSCTPPGTTVEMPVCIFREEEWFKVLLHELCHATGIDFSGLHNVHEVNEVVSTHIISIFNIRDIHIRLYEAYCETWATIINIMVCMHLSMPNERTLNTNTLSSAIAAEARWSVFQMIKVLHFFNMDYADLIEPKETNGIKPMDEKDVALFSYNIIKATLLAHAGEFLEWCALHSATRSAIQFTNTCKTVKSLCFFIRERYADPQFVQYAQIVSHIRHQMSKSPRTLRLLNTMCMSLHNTVIY